MKTTRIAALLAVLLFSLPTILPAHQLPGNPQTMEQQLQSCQFDLFRAQRPDGTYYAELANKALAEQYYPLIFREEFRENNRLKTRKNDDLARSLAPQMVDITLNLAYADALPSRSRKAARFKAMLVAVFNETHPRVLRSVLGLQAKPLSREHGLSAEVLGAGVLALGMIELYDKVAWGPQYVLEIKMPQWFGSTGWSLNGAPLSEYQFDQLALAATQHAQGLSAPQKSAFVGGPCLHPHPAYLRLETGVAEQVDDEEEGDRELDGGTIDVVGQLPYTDAEIYERLRNLGRSPASCQSCTTGGGGGGGSAPEEEANPFDEPPTRDEREIRECQDRCFKRMEGGFQARLLQACDLLGDGLEEILDQFPDWLRDFQPATAIRNCRGTGAVEGLKGRFDRCVEGCRLGQL